MSFPIVYYNVQWSIGITPGVSFHICDCWSFFFFPSWSWVTNCLRVIHHEEEREKLGTGWANLVLCSTWTDRAILSRLQGFSTWTRPKLLLSSSFALRIPLYYSSTSWYPFFLRLYTVGFWLVLLWGNPAFFLFEWNKRVNCPQWYSKVFLKARGKTQSKINCKRALIKHFRDRG